MKIARLSVVGPLLGLIGVASSIAAPDSASVSPVPVSVAWTNVVRVSETIPTTQHLANALTLRSNPLNGALLKALKDLHTNATRLQLWYSVPNQAVAELKEPTSAQTFWNFQYIDPVVIDFYANTSGLHHVNIGTIPRWMFNVTPVNIPTNPAASFYGYTNGTKEALLKDRTGKQFADYQLRLFQWYTQGGFTDEIGQYHASGYHFKIDYWGILNESVYENHLSVQQYTLLYDPVVEAIRQVDPNVQFFGPEVVGAGSVIPWASYFLDPKNHRPGIAPVQWFSLHNYEQSGNDPAKWQDNYFTGGRSSSARSFAGQLRQLVQLRDRLSPTTKIAIDELGTFNTPQPHDNVAETAEPYAAYDPLYWVATGANWAVNFITAERLGIQLISMTQMVGAPTQSESCSMINWDTAHPNAHYRVLELINDNFGPGDQLVQTESPSPDVAAQAFITRTGRKLLLVNTSDRPLTVDLATSFDSPVQNTVVDTTSGEALPRVDPIEGGKISLAPFAVAVVAAKGPN